MHWQPYYKTHRGTPEEPSDAPTSRRKQSGPRPILYDSPALIEEFWSLIEMSADSDACWTWHGNISGGGYAFFHSKAAHRYMFELVYGPIPPKMFVCHSCDNPPCINHEHFFLGTSADNTHDMLAKGRGKTILITNAVRSSIELAWQDREIKNGKTAYRELERLAQQFSLSKGMIANIANGRR